VLSQIALSVCRLELEQCRDSERVDLVIIGRVAGVFGTEPGEGDLAQRNASAIDKAGAIFRHRTERAGAGFDGEISISDQAEQVADKRDRKPAEGAYAMLVVEPNTDFLAEHVEIVVLDADGEFAFET
jgi:hypothetical protein